jgi:hypothetical protein
MGWLWHRKLAHIGMRNLNKLQKEGNILGLTNVVFEKLGLVEHVKPTSKLEHLTMLKTLWQQ